MPAATASRALACAVLLAGLPGAAGSLGAQEPLPQPAVPAVRVPPPLPRPWRFGLEIGFTDISGNRDLQLFQGGFRVEHQRQDERDATHGGSPGSGRLRGGKADRMGVVNRKGEAGV